MDEDIVLMEKYLDATLNEEEKAAFEARLRAEQLFAERFGVFKILYEQEQFAAKYGNEEKEFEATVKKTMSKQAPVISVKRKLYYIAISAAACIILFLGIRYLLNPASTDLYTKYAIHDELVIAERGENDSALSNAAALFNQHKYREAFPYIEKYTALHKDDNSMTIALGICFLETNQYEKALKLFDTVAAGNSLLKFKGSWYKALTYLKQKRINDCKIILQSIPSTYDKYDEVKKLLGDLE